MAMTMNPLTEMLENKGWRFARLAFSSIDNSATLANNDPKMAREETCLFGHGFSSGDGYLANLAHSVETALADHKPLPIVRFADGEYAFYAKSLHCNGLYAQAESVAAIEQSMPQHQASIKRLSLSGKLAPLIHPGNSIEKKKTFFSLFKRDKNDDSALTFLNFLKEAGVTLTQENYIPFYTVYAYLTSGDFARAVHGKKLCIVNSDLAPESCGRWFKAFASTPELSFVEIPAAHMATGWHRVKEKILATIPADSQLCLVGAGIGSLLLCVDIADHLNIPAIDGGHFLNMLNGRIDKSNGPRLYTIHKKTV